MRKLTYFVAGVCAGTLIGYVIRNSESADFNKGYNPETTDFDEKDYFTDDVLKPKKDGD